MYKALTAYCEKQGKRYTIEAEMINESALEDFAKKSKVGRIRCAYANETGNCTGANCSILNELGYKR